MKPLVPRRSGGWARDASGCDGQVAGISLTSIWPFDEDGKAIEHWDVLQPIPDATVMGNDMFSQLS